MKKTIILLIITCFAKTIVAQDATLIYKNTVNSTVTIETDIMLGSGFFVSKNVIATNYHVIKDANEAYCYTNNSSTKFKIEGYLAVDKSIDLILLQVSSLNGVAIKIASSSVSPGQKIYAIGSPKGLPASISDGIVSGLRDFEGHKLIQITAPISPGSSGGPVLNTNGELIGVSVGQFEDGQNLNFAIPKSYLESLLKVKTASPLPITKLYNKFGTLTDNRDGLIYKTVKIGNQIWMAENLKYDAYGSWCYENSSSNCLKYGRLYKWETAKNVCPTDWHLPSKEEFEYLIQNVGSNNSDVYKSLIQDGSSGFTAQFGGFCYDLVSFDCIDTDANYWSNSLNNGINGGAWNLRLYKDNGVASMSYSNEKCGFSIRCVKD
jgi:uncharacterized protein (TIGR02145 family)